MPAANKTFYQYFTFALIWITYCTTYFLRKPLGVVKPEIGAEFHLSKTELGWLDTSLLLPYAGVQILFSTLWDRYKPRNIMAICLFISSLSMLLFGISPMFIFACFFIFVNGAAQAPIWAACSKTLNSWFPEKRKSSVFGLVSTSPYVGALAGTGITIYIQVRQWIFFNGLFVSPLTDK